LLARRRGVFRLALGLFGHVDHRVRRRLAGELHLPGDAGASLYRRLPRPARQGQRHEPDAPRHRRNRTELAHPASSIRVLHPIPQRACLPPAPPPPPPPARGPAHRPPRPPPPPQQNRACPSCLLDKGPAPYTPERLPAPRPPCPPRRCARTITSIPSPSVTTIAISGDTTTLAGVGRSSARKYHVLTAMREPRSPWEPSHAKNATGIARPVAS